MKMEINIIKNMKVQIKRFRVKIPLIKQFHGSIKLLDDFNKNKNEEMDNMVNL